MQFQGVYTALITPFLEDGSVDESSLKKLVEEQIAAGVSGLVPMGTTGESPTMSPEEHASIIEKVIRWTNGKVPIVAGTGSNSTEEALLLTQKAKTMGATASLQVVPYYNKPNQEGMYRHFMTIAEKVDLPMIIYNIAGRTGKNLETDTLMKLAQNARVVGVKEASGDLNQITDVIARRPKGFSVLSGDDNLTFPLMALGGNGVISVASHIIPKPMVELCRAVSDGHFDRAREIHFQYLDLFKVLFVDTNPIPVKTAMALQGRILETFRLPMYSTESSKREAIKAVLKKCHLL